MNLLERNEVIRGYLRELSVWERGHAGRVAVYSVAVAVQMKMPARQLLTIRYAATLCGMESGADEKLFSAHPFLRAAGKIVGASRERCDGSGFPLGLAKEDIPVSARIVGACEVFDRLANGSPSEDPWATLESPAFDAQVVDALRRVADLIQPIGT